MRADLKRLKRDTDSGRQVGAGVVPAQGGHLQGMPPQEGGVVREPPLQKRRIWLLAAGGVVIVAAVVLGYLLTRPLPSPKVLAYSQVTNDGREKLAPVPGLAMAPLPLLTDGSRIYFSEQTLDLAIAQVSV